MLDCEPSEMDDSSAAESGGAFAPEKKLEVHVLERDRAEKAGSLRIEPPHAIPKPVSTPK